jgi:exosortase
MFWVWRIDILSLPFFVAGVAAIIFGVRALWRQRLAVAYLFLAWPLPYTLVLLRELNAFTTLTLHALRMSLHVVHVATAVPSADGSLFTVSGPTRSFQLSVVSACSGVNGIVGFLLVGTAFGAIVTGPRRRKTLWLLGGLILLWVINLGRLLLIFWAGHMFGEHFAIKVLHPYVGLFTFNIGIVIMLLLLKPVGLRIGITPNKARVPEAIAPSAVPPSPGLPAVPAVYSAIALVVAVGAILGVTNAGLRSYDLVASATGEPKLASYLDFPASPAGWRPTFASEINFAKAYFGEKAKWYRYSYSPTLAASDLHSDLPVTADVVNTNDLSSFSAYGIEACYRFHGYALRNVAQVRLGGGITGQALSYSAKHRQDWTVVYWIWPVEMSTRSTRYERVVLYMLNTDSNSVSGQGVSDLKNLQGSLNPRDETQRRLIAIRSFLVDFARQLVRAQSKVVPGSRLRAGL